jgi:hypothetical protein
MHKIPGTPYAPPSSSGSASPLGAMRSGGSFGNCADLENGGAGAADDDDTFKARMEKLSDKSSTNLYFEGLGFFFLSCFSLLYLFFCLGGG